MDPQITQAIDEAKPALASLDAPQEPWLRDLEGSPSLRPAPRIQADTGAMERHVPRVQLGDDSATARAATGMTRLVLGLSRELEAAEASRAMAGLAPRSGVRPVDLVLPRSVAPPMDTVPPWELWRLEMED
jgi:hypothetical protein